MNPHVNVVLHEARLSSENALELFAPYDIVIDAQNNFPTRYLTNDACVLLENRNVYGSVFRSTGRRQCSTRSAACYLACIRLRRRRTRAKLRRGGCLVCCRESSAHFRRLRRLSSLQRRRPLIGRLILFDAASFTTRELKLKKDPNVRICRYFADYSRAHRLRTVCGITPPPAVTKRRSFDGDQCRIIETAARQEGRYCACRRSGTARTRDCQHRGSSFRSVHLRHGRGSLILRKRLFCIARLVRGLRRERAAAQGRFQ